MPKWFVRTLTSLCLGIFYYSAYWYFSNWFLAMCFGCIGIYLLSVEFPPIAPVNNILKYATYVYIGGAWVILMYWSLHDTMRYIIALSFLLAASADIGAYITGSIWGKHKLAPAISPGKTWEGFFGGWCTAALMLLSICKLYGSWSFFIVIFAFVYSGTTTIIGLLGDLYISYLKRCAHIKDTGTCLPGHGGILDRFDSIIALTWYIWLSMVLAQHMQSML